MKPGIYRDMDAAEKWRAVPGFEGRYEVSSFGRVRSLDRGITYRRLDKYSGKIITVTKYMKSVMLRPGKMASGHQFVMLGRGNGFTVHTLVLNAFVGPAPEGMECCHNDGVASNNLVSNLRWDTRSENVLDCFRHGVRVRKAGVAA
jgi:hypothetical protein